MTYIITKIKNTLCDDIKKIIWDYITVITKKFFIETILFKKITF